MQVHKLTRKWQAADTYKLEIQICLISVNEWQKF